MVFLVLGLNIWLASKLAPINQNLAVANTKISIMEQRLERIEEKIDSLFVNK